MKYLLFLCVVIFIGCTEANPVSDEKLSTGIENPGAKDVSKMAAEAFCLCGKSVLVDLENKPEDLSLNAFKKEQIKTFQNCFRKQLGEVYEEFEKKQLGKAMMKEVSSVCPDVEKFFRNK